MIILCLSAGAGEDVGTSSMKPDENEEEEDEGTENMTFFN